jgi:hypothetical protein
MRLRIFLTAAMLLCVFAITNAQRTNKSAIFNGAWKSDDNKGFTVIHDGYFNSVGEDSTGKWVSMHAGTFTVNSDNTITFKVLYSSYPEHIGSLNTAEYSLNGETMKLHHFKKLITGEGKDITDQMPKDERETMIKMK